MPPARLPARIDRSGLGGGSVLSPPALGATGAVAAATEAMLTLRGDPPVYRLSLTKVALRRNRRAIASNREARRAARSKRSAVGRGSRSPLRHALGRLSVRSGRGRTNGLGGVDRRRRGSCTLIYLLSLGEARGAERAGQKEKSDCKSFPASSPSRKLELSRPIAGTDLRACAAGVGADGRYAHVTQTQPGDTHSTSQDGIYPYWT